MRSWLITMKAPVKRLSQSSSHSIPPRSRWLVGSSRKRTSGPAQLIAARRRRRWRSRWDAKYRVLSVGIAAASCSAARPVEQARPRGSCSNRMPGCRGQGYACPRSGSISPAERSSAKLSCPRRCGRSAPAGRAAGCVRRGAGIASPRPAPVQALRRECRRYHKRPDRLEVGPRHPLVGNHSFWHSGARNQGEAQMPVVGMGGYFSRSKRRR